MDWKIGIGIYTLFCIKYITNENGTNEHRGLYSMLCGDLNEKEIQGRGDTCIHVADSLCCTTETQHGNATILQF